MDRLLSLTKSNAPPPFPTWLSTVTPTFNWRWRHLVYVQQALERVTAGSLRRLMIFMPPRHGKSEMVTIRYPIWRMLKQKDLRCIVGAYNNDLAMQFSRKGQRVALEAGLRLTVTRADDWETVDGGGVRATGVGSGITGRGGHLILIDDPVKSREEANSHAYRERCWNWYTDDLYTRLEPDGAIILIMTRWHEDDLAGRILTSDDREAWEVISLPALAEDADPLGRAPGDALCPDRFDRESLLKSQKVMGSWSFSALYQQRPLPATGGMFQRDWFRITPAAPGAVKARVRYWDKASTAGGGDWSAGVLIGKTHDGRFVVEDVVRGQWSSRARRAIMLQTAALDKQRPGPPVRTVIEKEGGSSGKEVAENDIRMFAGYPVAVDAPTGSKEVRAQPLADQAEGGNVDIVAAPWNNAYLDEMGAFPFGAHDDQVDASSGAFAWLTSKGGNFLAHLEAEYGEGAADANP